MGISPGLFKAVVAGDNADFRGNQQQDASEFMLHLFDALEKQAKKDNQPNPAKLFEFDFEQRLEVNGKVQYQNVPETVLGIPINEDDVTNKSEVSEKVRGKVPFEKCLENWASDEAIANFKCPESGSLSKGFVMFFFSRKTLLFTYLCNSIKNPIDSTALRRLRFKSFPKYLILQSRRFTIGENWQPKKLNLSVDFPDKLDLAKFKATGAQPGETLLKGESKNDVTIDENLINQLSEMGYPYHASRKALYHNNQQLEVLFAFALSLLWLILLLCKLNSNPNPNKIVLGFS